MINAKSTSETFEHLSNLLRNNKRVFFSRFGDGDFFIMDRKDQRNHRFSEELHREMLESFWIEDPLYLKAVAVNYPRERFMTRGCLAPFQDNGHFEQIVRKSMKEHNNGPFENFIVFHYYAAFKSKLMNNFLDEFIRSKKVLYIGGVEKQNVEKVVGPNVKTIKTPIKDAYHEIDTWWPEVLKHLNNTEVIIPSAGMASRIINKRLWDLGIELHSIDIGSLFDAVSGKNTRTWIKFLGHRMQSVVLPQYQTKSIRKNLKHLILDTRYFIRTLYR